MTNYKTRCIIRDSCWISLKKINGWFNSRPPLPYRSRRYPICIFVPNNIRRAYFRVRDAVCIMPLHRVFIACRRTSMDSSLALCSARWTVWDRVEDVAARLQKEKDTVLSRRGRRTCVKLSSTPLGLITFVSPPRCDAVHHDGISSNWLIPMGTNVAVNSSKPRPYVPMERERCDHSSSSDGSFYEHLELIGIDNLFSLLLRMSDYYFKNFSWKLLYSLLIFLSISDIKIISFP